MYVLYHEPPAKKGSTGYQNLWGIWAWVNGDQPYWGTEYLTNVCNGGNFGNKFMNYMVLTYQVRFTLINKPILFILL